MATIQELVQERDRIDAKIKILLDISDQLNELHRIKNIDVTHLELFYGHDNYANLEGARYSKVIRDEIRKEIEELETKFQELANDS